MNDCKYCKDKVSDNIKHVTCTNEEMKTINNSEDKDIPCMGVNCGKYVKTENGDEK